MEEQVINQIAHIRTGAKNLAETESFYCGVLGLEKCFSFTKKDKEVGFYIKVGNRSFIEIFEQKEIEVGSQPLLQHFCLEVDDIDQVIKCLNEAKVEVSEKRFFSDNTWQVWTKDPNGVSIEFHQYTQKSCQIIGGDCKLE